MTDRRTEDVWKAAVARYTEKTGHSLDDALPTLPDHVDLAALFAHIDKDNGKYEKYKERRNALQEALNPVLHVVGYLAETAGETGVLFYPPSKAIPLAVFWLVAVGRNYSNRYDAIINLFAYLNESLGRVKIHSARTIATDLRASTADTLGHTLTLLGIARKALEGGQLKLLWKITGGEADRHLERLTAQENSVVSVETLSGVNTALEKLSQQIDAEQRDPLPYISIGFQFVRDDKYMAWMKAWLNPPRVSHNHLRHLDLQEEQTGLWFLQGTQFTQWKEVSDSFIWIQGPPGCGKSVLLSSAIEAVIAHCSNNRSSTCLYFYFDFSDNGKQTYEGLLHWLLLLLAGSVEAVPEPLLQLREVYGHGLQHPDATAIVKIIHELCSLFDDVYLMIDALDECSSTDLGFVLDFLSNLRQADRFSLHTLVTSRPELDIINRSKNSEIGAISIVGLTESVVQPDINLYIRHRIKTDTELMHHGEGLGELIEESLSKKARGIFRWASLQLDDLATCRTPAMLQEALKELPTTLSATYSHILDTIEPGAVPYMAMMLSYLIYSKRSVTLEEIVAAGAAVNLHSGNPLNPKTWFSNPRVVLKLCPGLVTSFLYCESQEDQAVYVQLAHSSVREYLLSDAARQYACRFNLSQAQAHDLILRTSLRVLTSLDEPHMTKKVAVERQPLAQHAAEFWPYHFCLCSHSTSSRSDVSNQLKRLFDRNNDYFYNWICCYDHDPVGRDAPDTAADVLYYASLIGIYEVCLWVLNEDAANAKTNRSLVHALGAASAKGHAEVARLLLDRGADINIPGGDYGSALGAACFNGHAEIARLLLDRGADINIPGGHYGSALGAACFSGHAEIARLLLDCGADVNMPGEDYGSALGAACLIGNIDIARLLVDCGADIDIPGGHYGSALGAACLSGNIDVARLLVDCGAVINIPGGYYGSALGAACLIGNIDVARLLVDRGADINISGGDYGSALEAACFNGHVEVVKLLVDCGADVNIPGGIYGCALGAACFVGHVEIARLLLDRGADINAPCGDYGSALGAACCYGQLNIARLLLDRNADISILREWL